MMTDTDDQRRKAETFLQLHRARTAFVLPNAWDVASAQVFALEGFRAIGTTSAGIAATLGYPDGQAMSLAENLEVARRIVGGTTLPVSVDLEAGYSETPAGAAEAARALLATGAVGLNIEDSKGRSLVDQALQQEKITAIRDLSNAAGVHLVINARSDAFMVTDDPARGLRQAIDRGNSYAEAGADCVFVPDVGTLDRTTIAILIKEIDGPLNIIAGETTPPVPELGDMGVSRVSLGPRPMRALLSLLRKIAKELKATGTYELMMQSSISYSEVNRWFAGGREA